MNLVLIGVQGPASPVEEGVVLFTEFHWCPVKYFVFVDKRLDMKFLEGVPPKNDLN